MPRTASPPVLLPSELEKLGLVLFGEAWQTAMARRLEKSDRYIRQLLNGDRPIHAELVKELIALCRQREGAIRAMAAMLEEKLKGT